MYVRIRYHYRPSDDREEYFLFVSEPVKDDDAAMTTEMKVEVDFNGKLTAYEPVYEATQLSVWRKVGNDSARGQAVIEAVETDLAKRRAAAEGK